jgi:cholesterol oxidase
VAPHHRPEPVHASAHVHARCARCGAPGADKIGGVPGASVFENFDAALTAHFVGGCVIGADENSGVVDAYHRAFGYDGLHIVDGSTITANLGVNPSLTITAQAERAMAMWPNKGQADQRPPVGVEYLPAPVVAPEHPVVPLGAPGELRLTPAIR